ncbi:hypothetical protein L6164_009041 [Bauhinia variegata]|uniref:Uncharacterized protein n=1 Tax=Bauhinia variegata TaxID=167791 RepID=A0ACB9PIP5_BAUVA|nr:hypothetical protein L6164_009041 [Bauhinia variegata]
MCAEKETGSKKGEHLSTNDSSLSSKKALPVRSSGSGFWVSSHSSPTEKMRVCENKAKPELKWHEMPPSKSNDDSSGEKPQDADYNLPSLSDEIETLIMARVPRSEYWKFSFVNKRFLGLLKTGEVYKIRRQIGFKEPSVFMFADGETNWCAFDQHFMHRRKLPVIPSDDIIFEYCDKESFSAGTNLFVLGQELAGAVIWRYELATNKWLKNPSMISPRCLFASATCGTFAYVAGGLDLSGGHKVSNSAEKYNAESDSWESLPPMNKKRRNCSGCYMDNKFYVIGGQDDVQKDLSCGECFDEKTKEWSLIPDMLKDIPVSTAQSPPLVAVANNELYTVDASSNELKVYLKASNSWRKIGPAVPVRADARRGWGVAFKSLGNELLVIGSTSADGARRASIYTCCPDPALETLQWREIKCGTQLNPFIRNCAVMIA